MRTIYLALGVIIVLIFIGFGIARWTTQRALNAAASFDMSTPSPAPGYSAKPVQIHDLQTIGAQKFVKPDPAKGIFSDTVTGGHGQLVDGIPCAATEAVQVHVHSHLALFVNGQQVQIPPYIGMSPTATGGCLYWLHTHDASGIIHVEAGSLTAPNGGPYTLGQFFDIWGQPLTRTQIGPFKGNVTAYVNGASYTGDLAAIPLHAHQIITLEVGTPIVPPPNYKLPPND